MHRCSGCGYLADRTWRFDSSRGICTRCAQTLRAVEFTDSLVTRQTHRCLGCGDAVHHGIRVCTWCRAAVMEQMAARWGLDILNDNPFIYEMCKPAMLFRASIGDVDVSMTREWVQGPSHGNFREITFRGLDTISKNTS